MAIRVRSDGTMWCAAHTEPLPGDTYIDDGLHYEMSVEHGVIVALSMPEHVEHPQWWWTAQAPNSANFAFASPVDSAGEAAPVAGNLETQLQVARIVSERDASPASTPAVTEEMVEMCHKALPWPRQYYVSTDEVRYILTTALKGSQRS